MTCMYNRRISLTLQQKLLLLTDNHENESQKSWLPSGTLRGTYWKSHIYTFSGFISSLLILFRRLFVHVQKFNVTICLRTARRTCPRRRIDCIQKEAFRHLRTSAPAGIRRKMAASSLDPLDAFRRSDDAECETARAGGRSTNGPFGNHTHHPENCHNYPLFLFIFSVSQQ